MSVGRVLPRIGDGPCRDRRNSRDDVVGDVGDVRAERSAMLRIGMTVSHGVSAEPVLSMIALAVATSAAATTRRASRGGHDRAVTRGNWYETVPNMRRLAALHRAGASRGGVERSGSRRFRSLSRSSVE